MAFGQQAGPPATARQVRELVDLVVAAGHVDLRDARHALGLTQRQAAGKFTRDEAQILIDQLLEAEDQAATAEAVGDGPAPDAEPSVPAAVRQKAAATERRAAAQARDLRSVPAEALAAELQRRGWAVVQP